MQELLNSISNSQAPWMALSILLVVFIIKLQNDKLVELCKSMAALALLYQQHDEQAKEIKEETTWIQKWCISQSCNVDCVPNSKHGS